MCAHGICACFAFYIAHCACVLFIKREKRAKQKTAFGPWDLGKWEVKK